jgi:hypothetical protein
MSYPLVPKGDLDEAGVHAATMRSRGAIRRDDDPTAPRPPERELG